MTKPQDRNKKYKYRKSASETKREYFRGKHKKTICAITKKVLHGVPHETKVGHAKKSKTEKRPSAPFGGILSGEAREKVFIELGKVIAGIKQVDDVDQKYRKYVKQVMNRAEVE
jgi:ribosomal protein L34E